MAKITLIGHIGKDATTKQVSQDRIMIIFSVAETTTKGRGSDRKEFTQWYNVAYFSNSENMLNILQKGNRVVVFGELDIDTMKSEKTGETYVNCNITANDIKVVAYKNEPAETEQPQQQSTPQPSMPAHEPEQQGDSEDLPF